MKQWHFCDKVYRVYVILIVGSPEEFNKWLIKEAQYTGDIDELNAIGNAGLCMPLGPENNSGGNTCFVVWMRTQDLPVLVHELSHLSGHVLDEKGISLEYVNTETYAYYLEHWFIEVTGAWNRFPKGKNSLASPADYYALKKINEDSHVAA